MKERLLGRCLIRRAEMTNGQKALVLCGVFIPQNMNIESFDDRDEMWLTELSVADGTIKFSNANKLQFSPEDFLGNVADIQENKNWQRKYE